MSEKHFPLNSCFQSADAILSAGYKSLKDIRAHCLVALDANVLLAPYGLGAKPLAEIVEIYKALAKNGRLALPGQSLREFAKHRNGKIAELIQTVETLKSKLGNPMEKNYSFLQNLPDYVSALTIAKEIEEKNRELKNRLTKVADAVRGWNMGDPVWDSYREIMTGSAIELSNEAKADLPRDLQFRVQHSLPPGYKDADKSDGGAGDLIIWRTILEVAKAKQADMVFVTMDQKNDWWTQAGGAALFPRLELIEEFRNVTGGFTLHIIKFSEFLDLFGAEMSAVEEVQRVESVADSADLESVESSARSSRFPDALRKSVSLIKMLELKQSEIERIIEDKRWPLERYMNRGDQPRIDREMDTITRLQMERDTISSEIHRLKSKFSERNSIGHMFSPDQSSGGD